MAQGAFANASGNGWWWLRSPGRSYSNENVADGRLGYTVEVNGNIADDNPTLLKGSVRPVMWIHVMG